MDADDRWHEGEPPEAWRRAPDGRWHAPPDDDPVAETQVITRVRWDPAVAERRPRGLRRAGPLVVVVLGALVGIAAVVTSGDGLGTSGVDTAGRTTTVPPSTEPPSPSAAADATGDPLAAPPADAPPETLDPEPTVTTAPPSTPTTAPAPPATVPTTVPAPALRALCRPEGATALLPTGVPIVCTVEKCHGAPFPQPRWREVTC